MTEERIIFLDPRGALAETHRALSNPGRTIQVLVDCEEDLLDLVQTEREGGASRPPTILVADGDSASGLHPSLANRWAEMGSELPILLVALVPNRACGAEWVRAGAVCAVEQPVDPETLRSEVDRWLRFLDRFSRSERRMGALRKFFAMFAHDLKNPLNAIQCYCDLVINQPDLAAETRDSLQRIRRNTEILELMAQGVLAVVRGVALWRIQPVDVELGPVVAEAVEMLRVPALARRVAIRQKAEGPSAVVRIESPRIIEALTNILDNAVRFSPEGGTIEVGIVTREQEVLITVDDEGPGIPARDRSGIFVDIGRIRVSRGGSGLGLGLSIAREIVELHRGAIWAEAGAKGGARIVIRLPVVRSGNGTELLPATTTESSIGLPIVREVRE